MPLYGAWLCYFLIVSFLPVSALVVSTPVFAGESTFAVVDAESIGVLVLSPKHEASDRTVKATKPNFTMFFILVIC